MTHAVCLMREGTKEHKSLEIKASVRRYLKPDLHSLASDCRCDEIKCNGLIIKRILD